MRAFSVAGREIVEISSKELFSKREVI